MFLTIETWIFTRKIFDNDCTIKVNLNLSSDLTFSTRNMITSKQTPREKQYGTKI